MKIGVVGLGVSGAIFAISYKRNHRRDEIIFFEHLDTPLKKVLATGNGKCNIGNNSKIENIYNSNLAESILYRYDFKTQNRFLDSINIKTKMVGNLCYPISESAVTVRNALIKELSKADVKIIYNAKVEDYSVNDNSIDLFLEDKTIRLDKIIFATGGKSSPNSGSDGSIFDILKSHGYKINEINPGLCPIYTKENTKIVSGTRIKSEIKVLDNKKIIFQEKGELLFKDHGLSGIVIFNASRIIARNISTNYVISVDFLPEISREELGIFLSFHDQDTLLEAYLHPSVIKFLKQKAYKNNIDLINAIKGYRFTFDKLDGFEHSQISIGGISLNNVDEKLKSKLENNVYFIGEILDVDAPCGGYNLMWAIASGLLVSDFI